MTDICRPRLLDSTTFCLFIQALHLLGTVTTVLRTLVCPVVLTILLLAVLSCLQWTPLPIALVKTTILRRMTFIRLCRSPSAILWTLRLLTATVFLITLQKWGTRRYRAAPLLLEGLMRVMAPFVGTLRSTLWSILIFLLQRKAIPLSITRLFRYIRGRVLGVLITAGGALTSLRKWTKFVTLAAHRLMKPVSPWTGARKEDMHTAKTSRLIHLSELSTTSILLKVTMVKPTRPATRLETDTKTFTRPQKFPWVAWHRPSLLRKCVSLQLLPVKVPVACILETSDLTPSPTMLTPLPIVWSEVFTWAWCTIAKTSSSGISRATISVSPYRTANRTTREFTSAMTETNRLLGLRRVSLIILNRLSIIWDTSRLAWRPLQKWKSSPRRRSNRLWCTLALTRMFSTRF